MEAEHVDVLIVGAGLSGIAAGYYLQKYAPKKSYTILEGRDAAGGTWDLFRYPGIRSDSPMNTFGYSFRPWNGEKAIAGGPEIRQYLWDTAREYGIDRKIRFGQRVLRAAWSSAEACWSVEVARGANQEIARFTCQFLFMCSGYYEYAQGYLPEWPGVERFTGQIVHPQQWPENLEYTDKRVVVIGSGATAVTLVPSIARQATHVTMLQRSPTYVVPGPSEDADTKQVQRWLPSGLANRFTRWRSILSSMYLYYLARRYPAATRTSIMRMAQAQLGPDYDVDTHFAPRYNPWDQRVCLDADGDLFASIRSGKTSVVTDQIATFTEHGIQLESGVELPADIIVTATGLVMRLMGGVQLTVDGKPVEIGKTINYKGVMFSDIPNLAMVFGYTNASWTLKCELICAYICRLLNYMDQQGYAFCTPRRIDPSVREEPALGFTSGYVQRARDTFPRQGNKKPWRLYQNYLLDLISLQFGRLNDGTMEFTR